jgi:DNA-binding protein YbaB
MKAMKFLQVLKYARSLMVVGVLMIAAAIAPGDWVARMGFDFWNMSRLKAELRENQRLSKEMDAESALLSVRIQVKDSLVRDLIAGRASLEAVSNQFYALNSDDPEVIRLLQKQYHLDDVRAVSALNVLTFAETYLDCDAHAKDRNKVMERLDAEFDRLFPELATLDD